MAAAVYRFRIHAALLTVQLLFGSWPVVGKVVLRSIPGFMLIGMRASAAAVVFFILGQRARLTRRQHGLAALAGLLGISVNQLLFIEGLTRTTAVNSAVLATTIPLWTLVFSLLTGTERPTRLKLVGMGTAFTGALVVTGAGRLEMGETFLQGNLILLCSTASYAAYLIVSRKLAQELPPLALVPWTFFYGALFALPFALPVAMSSAVPWTPVLILLCLYVLAGPTVGTYYLNTMALKEAPPSLVAVYIYVQPVMAALLAVPLLGEFPSPSLLLGGAFIFTGVFLSTR